FYNLRAKRPAAHALHVADVVKRHRGEHHLSQLFVESPITAQAVPLRSDGKVHERGIAKRDPAVQLFECSIHFAHGSIKDRLLNEPSEGYAVYQALKTAR